MKNATLISAAAVAAVLALGACNRQAEETPAVDDAAVDATATTDEAGGMAADASGGGSAGGGSTSGGSSSGGSATGGSNSGSMSGESMSTTPAPTMDPTGGMPQGSTATAPRSSATNEQVPGGPVAPGTPVSPPRGGVTQGPRDPATGR